VKTWIRRLSFGFSISLLWVASVLAATLEELGSGKHSMLDLGEKFSIIHSVKRNRTAKLAFFNYELADRLGITYPKDPKKLEALILEHFAWEIDPTGESPKKWFASYYQDGSTKMPGDALGDGRALWTGELKIQRPDGKILYVDAVQKGIGVTAVAPTSWDSAHQTGTQLNSELVHSGIMSIANLNNGLDSTADLFGLTFERNGEWVSSTLRLGNQTRPAHLRYHADNPADFKRIYEYIVRRDLGLPLDTPITKKLVNAHLEQFARIAGEDAGRSFDLHAIQENPTSGNKTTKGSQIDLGGLRYLDAPHPNFTTMRGRVFAGEQPSDMRAYLLWMLRDMEEAKYLFAPRDAIELFKLFDQEFKAAVTRSWLVRLGLSQAEIDALSEPIKKRYFESVMTIYNTSARTPVRMIGGNDRVRPSAFDPRNIFKNTMSAMSKSGRSREWALNSLFAVTRSWGEALAPDTAKIKKAYLDSVEEIAAALSANGTPTIKPEWIKQAAKVNSKSRHELTEPYFWIDHEGPMIAKLDSRKFTFREINRMMTTAANAITDKGLPIRPETNVGFHPAFVRTLAKVPVPRPARCISKALKELQVPKVQPDAP